MSVWSSQSEKKFRVFVSQPIPQQAVDIFNSSNVELVISDKMPSRQKLLESVKDIDGIFCTLNEKIDKELLDTATNLKVNIKILICINIFSINSFFFYRQ
jgi:phosphoglycerate dehydrogenase-like enzyme